MSKKSFLSTGNARVASLQKDPSLTDKQSDLRYRPLCVRRPLPKIVVTRKPYSRTLNSQGHISLLELPSNLLLRKIGPRLLMPTLLSISGVSRYLKKAHFVFPTRVPFPNHCIFCILVGPLRVKRYHYGSYLTARRCWFRS